MFGAGLPVCAAHYPTLVELVSEGRNGVCFKTAQHLASHLARLLRGFGQLGGGGGDELARLRAGAAEAARCRWQTNWEAHALPVLRSLGV